MVAVYQIPLVYLIDLYVIVSNIIFFVCLFVLCTLFEKISTRELTNSLINLVVFFSIGYIVVGLYCFFFSNFFEKHYGFLNGYFILSTETFYFRA